MARWKKLGVQSIVEVRNSSEKILSEEDNSVLKMPVKESGFNLVR